MTSILQVDSSTPRSAAVSVARVSSTILPQRLRSLLVFLLVWVLGGVYAGSLLHRGWVPHDEGAFAQSADRVLHGQLPHRDFTEIYTGGLAYLHAFAFRCFGENLGTLRLVLLVFFVAWIPAFYWIVLQFARDWAAGGVTLLAVAWSLPNYSAAVPSWYNMFFATFGCAALFAYLRRGSRAWLFIAGLSGGFSFLAKTVALYYLAAVFLFLVFLEQDDPALSSARPRGGATAYTAFLGASLLLFVAGLTHLIGGRSGIEELVAFVFPVLTMACFLLLNEQRARGRSYVDRFAALLARLIPFGIGFTLPSLAFLVPYLRAHALSAFLEGVFILPVKRVSGAYMAPPHLVNMLPVLGLAAVLAASVWLRGWARWLLTMALAGFSTYLLLSSSLNRISYLISWYSASWLIPPLTVFSVLMLRRPIEGLEPFDRVRRQQLFLLLSLSSVGSLVQFPFAAPIYFCYVAPLAILALASLLAMSRGIPRPLLVVLALHFLFFAVFRVTPGFIHNIGRHYEPDAQTEPLGLPRADHLRVDRDSATLYRELISVAREHAGAGNIYAAPDCPEVYFLAGYQNLTPTMFDFFEEPNVRTSRVLQMVDSHPVRVVVINLNPPFSQILPGDLREALAQRFPEKQMVGFFEVRWR